MSQSASVRELAARLARLERDIRNVSVTPQLGHSSLDDEAVNVYDADGGLKATVGRQHDGTYTTGAIDGPVPPVPAGLSTVGGPGEGTVVWDGTYAGDVRAPMDFHVVEVWVAAADFTDRADARLLGHFSNESGGELTAALPVGEWFVGLVCKSQSGRRSGVSGRVVVVVESVVDQAALDALESALEGLDVDLEDLTGTVLPGLRSDLTDLTDVRLPALDTALSDARGDITDAFGRIDTVEGAASEAQTAADNAGIAAGIASDAASDAAGLAEGKGEVIYQGSAPTGDKALTQNLWIRASDNKPHTWDGSQWVESTDKAATDAAEAAGIAKSAADDAQEAADLADDAAVTAKERADEAHTLAGTAEGNAQTAITSAGNAQTAADNVAKSLFSPSNPSGTAPYGSTWFKVNTTGEVVGQWQQTGSGIASTWSKRDIRSEVIANLDVGKLTAGTANIATVTAQKIAGAVGTFLELNATQINAGKIDTERLNAAAVGAAVGAFIDLKADQITAIGAGFDTAVVNDLFADMFAANQITAGMINTETLGADAGFIGVLNSATIIGAMIKTAASGLRTQIDTEGLRTFNAANEETARLSADGGAMKLGGELNVTGEIRVPKEGGGNVLTIGNSSISIGADNGNPLASFGVTYDPNFPNPLTVTAGNMRLISDYRILLGADLIALSGETSVNGEMSVSGPLIAKADLEVKGYSTFKGESTFGDSNIVVVEDNPGRVVLNAGGATIPKPTNEYHITNKRYVDGDDAEWIDLSYFLANGYTVSNFEGMAIGRHRFLRVSTDTNSTKGFPTGTTTFTKALPAKWRPDYNTQGSAWFSGGATGTSFIRPDGTIAASHKESTRSTVQASISYMV